MSKSKNDIQWEKLFNKYKILERISQEGHTIITSANINAFRQARLMTKFDHKSQLPKLFTDNKLSILPISRGSYVIGQFETFFDFDKDIVEATKIHFPTYLESLDFKEITSESTAINCAFVSEILHDFTEEEKLFPTVSGRMSSSSFTFNINSSKGLFKINVNNSQIEIDGGFEGDNSLYLIEAKNYISDDFLVRQLYYPYKLWSGKIQKNVRPIFLTYTNGSFHLREYSFENLDHYNSLVLVKHKKYLVQEEEFNTQTIEDLINKTLVIPEPQIPFPQADSFDRVINLCELLSQKGFMSKENITRNYDFDKRQTDYYTNAAKYLGLITIDNDPDNGHNGCFLTNIGKQIFKINLFDRQKEFIKLIIRHAAFQQTLILYLETGEVPNKKSIFDIMQKCSLYNIKSEVTYNRRSSTIIGWVNWIINLIEE